MLARIEHLKDVLNTNYLCIRVQPEALSPFLGQMRQALGDMFDLYAGMQARRDLGTHHISVVTTSEYNSLSERMGIDRWVSSLDRIMDMEFDVTLLGLGAASGGGSKPATLETGAVIQVPLFVDVGDHVKVQTESGEYMSRA